MKRLTTALLLVNLAAALTGNEVLDRVRAATNARDREATATMTITDKGGRVQTRTLSTVMKGDDKLMMTFKSPADLRGVTFLTTSSANMWIYLPAQGRNGQFEVPGDSREAAIPAEDLNHTPWPQGHDRQEVLHGLFAHQVDQCDIIHPVRLRVPGVCSADTRFRCAYSVPPLVPFG